MVKNGPKLHIACPHLYITSETANNHDICYTEVVPGYLKAFLSF